LDYRVRLDLPDQPDQLEPLALLAVPDSGCQEQQVSLGVLDFQVLQVKQGHQDLQEQLAILAGEATQVDVYNSPIFFSKNQYYLYQ